MPWQLAILLASIFSGARSIQNRRIGLEKNDYSLYALLISMFLVSVNGIIIANVANVNIDFGAAWSSRYYLLLGGSVFAFGNYIVLRMYRYINASIAILLSLLTPVMVVVLAKFTAGELLTAEQALGGLFVLSSVFVAQYISVKNSKSLKYKKFSYLGLFLAFTASMFMAIGVVNEKYLLGRLGLENYLVFGWSMQFIAAVILVVLLRKKFKLPKKRIAHLNVWIYGLLLAMGGLFFVLSQNYSNSSLTTLGNSFKTVITILLAYIFLNEKKDLTSKLVSIFLSSIGLFLLFR